MGHGIRLIAIELFADDFYQHAFAATAIKFAVENLFPRAKVEFAIRNGDNNLTAHDLTFHVRVGVVLARAVMMILRCRLVWREFFKPDIIIVQQTVLGIVDVNARGDVHGIDKAKSLLHAAFMDKFLNRTGDVDVIAPMRRLKPKMFGQTFHAIRKTAMRISIKPPPQ